MTAFTHPIKEFPPGAELIFTLGVGHRILHSDLSPIRLAVTAQYEYSGRHVTERTQVDLQPYVGSGMPIDPIAERLDGLQEELRKGFKLLADA